MLYDDYTAEVAEFKRRYGDRVLVVFEVGSFYEWYNCDRNAGCDVQAVCELLNIVKTRKDKRIPEVSRDNPEFAGVPNYAFPKFVPLLLEAGYTIALFKQHHVPIVGRDGKPATRIERVLDSVQSRGTCVDAGGAGCRAYDGGRGNYVAALFLDSHTVVVDSITQRRAEVMHVGCSLVDVTSGVSIAYEINSASDDTHFAVDEIHRIVSEYQPSEVVLYGRSASLSMTCTTTTTTKSDKADEEAAVRAVRDFLEKASLDRNNGVYDRLDREDSKRLASVKFQESILRRVFGEGRTGFLSAIEALDLETKPHACASFAGLLQFVFEHNEHVLDNMARPTVITACDGDYEYTTEEDAALGENAEKKESRRAMLNYNAAEQLNILGRQQQEATLCSVLDCCVTSMGRRYFKHQLLHPLVRPDLIRRRLDEVEGFVTVSDQLMEVRARLRKVGDLERLFRRFALGTSSPHEFVALEAALAPFEQCCLECVDRLQSHAFIIDDVAAGAAAQQLLCQVTALVSRTRSCYLGKLAVNCHDADDAVVEQQRWQKQNSCFDACDAVFCPGLYPDIDAIGVELSDLRAQMMDVVEFLNSLCGASSSAAATNNNNSNKKVFFRIEKAGGSSSVVSAVSAVGETAAPKTLESITTNSRYVVVGTHMRCDALLKQSKSKAASSSSSSSSAASRHNSIDLQQLGTRRLNSSTSCVTHPVLERLDADIRKAESVVREEVDARFAQFLAEAWTTHGETMTELARSACHLDYVTTCAHNAVRYRHVRPRVLDAPSSDVVGDGSWMSAVQLRHPVLEVVHDRTPHVANDISVGTPEPPHRSLGVLVYGMNAAGKSCLMKAVALAAIMAQAGMFVAASSAEMVPFSKFFTRIQTRDDLTRGLSTFMVEMSELRNILKRCDSRSLVIGDEICSGTEAVSALSIVGSSVRRLLHRRVPFLFATHLHELPRALKSADPRPPSPDGQQKQPAGGAAGRKEDVKDVTATLRICHLRVTYDARTGRLVYDRRLADGQGPTVYGLEVCRALDMDAEFVDTAHRIRRALLRHHHDEETTRRSDTLGGDKTSRYNRRVVVDGCGVCGAVSSSSPEVHHIRFQSEADDRGIIDGRFHKNAAFNLVPLCRTCHQRVHDGRLRVHGFVQTSEGVALAFDEQTNTT